MTTSDDLDPAAWKDIVGCDKLQSMNLPGNLHEAAAFINAHHPYLVDRIVAMDTTGRYTVVVYRYPADVTRMRFDLGKEAKP